jgi:NAD(P)-dependent dehydrogenase (short-subunit alcohol dehydrogenase family)
MEWSQGSPLFQATDQAENLQMKPKGVLVAGAYGVIGRQAALHFAAQPDTTVIGLSRRTGLHLEGVRLIPIDLLEPQDVRSKLGSLKEVTHIVFGAYIEKPTAREKSQVNVAACGKGVDRREVYLRIRRHDTYFPRV